MKCKAYLDNTVVAPHFPLPSSTISFRYNSEPLSVYEYVLNVDVLSQRLKCTVKPEIEYVPLVVVVIPSVDSTSVNVSSL